MQKYFEEQPTTRPEQVALLKEKTQSAVQKRFPTLDDIAPGWKNVKAPDPYAYAMMNYVYTRGYSDLSGWKIIALSGLRPAAQHVYSKPEIVTEQPKPRRVSSAGAAAPAYFRTHDLQFPRLTEVIHNDII